MKVLEGLQPAPVWKYFEELCNIPHISHHEKELSDYCVRFAQERDLFCEQDELGNVIIVAEATSGYEEEDALIIQGHLDMVGDKVPECPIDMEKEPIKIKVEGEYVTAEGTTLGGDDGIAVAYAFALLDSEDIPHPRLEVVLTVGEEVGLIGATGIDLSVCKGRKLLNIDSDTEGILTVGCAGGVRITSEISANWCEYKGSLCELTFEGLRGGHSGMEINKGRANANVLMGRLLQILKKETAIHVADVQGGVKENVIPKESIAKLLVDKGQEEVFQNVVHTFQKEIAEEYEMTDPDIRVNMVIGEAVNAQVLTEESLNNVVEALVTLPNGVQAMNEDLPDLVETSINLGVVRLEKEHLSIYLSARSSVAEEKEKLVAKCKKISESLGGSIELQGDYPAWPYKKDSELREKCVEIFKKQYGHEPKVEIIHAGLECGILSAKVPGLDCVSIGPDMLDIHTPEERVNISSVQRVWEYVKAVVSEK